MRMARSHIDEADMPGLPRTAVPIGSCHDASLDADGPSEALPSFDPTVPNGSCRDANFDADGIDEVLLGEAWVYGRHRYDGSSGDDQG